MLRMQGWTPGVRDCSVPENPGVNSSTLGMPGLDCSVQWILGVC